MSHQRGGKVWVKPSHFKLDMKTIRDFAGMSKRGRNDSRKLLIQDNNNHTGDGYNRVCPCEVNLSAQNALNAREEQRRPSDEQIAPQIPLQELAELLGVEDGSSCSTRPELVQRYVSQRLPAAPADMDGGTLPRHLLNMQETVRKELVRLGPLSQSIGLIECYHRQMFHQLDELLKDVSSAKNSFMLLDWVLNTYLSREMLTHPDHQGMNPVQQVDLLLFTEWVEKAKVKLLEHVQKEVRASLEKILQFENTYHELHVDTLQCIHAMHKGARKINPRLSDPVREVCFRELLTFVKRYTAKQTETLQKTVDMQVNEHLFMTLNNCKHIKQYVQTEAKDLENHRLKETTEETVATLEHMETLTLKLLMKMVADVAENHLKKYFKSGNEKFFPLVDTVTTQFSELPRYEVIQTTVMDEAYKLIAHIYLKLLIRSSRSKLRRCWTLGVAQTVAEDAALLHDGISDLAPGVRQWNLMLLKVTELLECKSPDEMKMTVGSMLVKCHDWSEDLDLLPALLRWNGLYRWQVREVLDALQDLPSYRPRPTSASRYWCITWCIT